jgi:hypothetical protein
MMDKETWESSPYASVYKYSHDVFPAKAGLGTTGCTDCHSLSSDIFYKKIVKYPFGEDGIPVFEPQYARLGMGSLQVLSSAVREQYVKTLQYPAFFFLVIVILLSVLLTINKNQNYFRISSGLLTWVYGIMVLVFILIFLKPDVSSYVLPDRLALEKNHFLISILALVAGIYTWLEGKKQGKQSAFLYKFLRTTTILVIISGMLMMIKFEAIYVLVRIAYTLFDIGIVVIILLATYHLVNDQFSNQRISSIP